MSLIIGVTLVLLTFVTIRHFHRLRRTKRTNLDSDTPLCSEGDEEIEGEEEGLLNELNHTTNPTVPPTVVVHSRKQSCTKLRVANSGGGQCGKQCRSPVEELARRFQIHGENDEEEGRF